MKTYSHICSGLHLKQALEGYCGCLVWEGWKLGRWEQVLKGDLSGYAFYFWTILNYQLYKMLNACILKLKHFKGSSGSVELGNHVIFVALPLAISLSTCSLSFALRDQDISMERTPFPLPLVSDFTAWALSFNGTTTYLSHPSSLGRI